MLKHRYSYFHNISNKRLCDCTKRIIHASPHLFFEGFIYMQCWINHICNQKLVNVLLYIIMCYEYKQSSYTYEIDLDDD